MNSHLWKRLGLELVSLEPGTAVRRHEFVADKAALLSVVRNGPGFK